MNDGIYIENGYKIWSYSTMKQIMSQYTSNPKLDFNRTYIGMGIEWYIHNIGYYLTLPFIFIPCISKLNIRFKHINLEAH